MQLCISLNPPSKDRKGHSSTMDKGHSSNKLDEARKDKWVQAVENMDFTHSSRKAWSLLRKISSGTTSSKPSPTGQPSPESIAKRLVKLTKFPRQKEDKKVTYKLNEIKHSQQQALEVSRPLLFEELET